MAHLIDKDALIAEIDRQKIGYNVDGKHSVEYDIVRKIIDIINSLETKDVDLEKEIRLYKMRNPIIGHREESLKDIEYTRTDALIEKACDAYCKVCGHFAHSVPTHICRHDCEYFSDFKKYMEG